MRAITRPINIAFVLPLIFLSACGKTVLPPLEFPQNILSLSSESTRAVALKVEISPAPAQNRVGHQFLFPFFPISSVQLPHLERDLYNQLFTSLALRGIKVVPDKDGVRSLILATPQVSLGALDFIVTRRVAAEVSLSARLVTEAEVLGPITVSQTCAEYRRFGFSRELTLAYRKALEQAAHKLLESLPLG